MLEGLDEVPWHELSHAYGSAEDVPGLLRELQNERSHETALWHLFGNIWHQNTVYEATAYAVPFLIELAADAETPDRPGILSLLSCIAGGASYLAVHGNLFNSSEFERQLEQEQQWVVNAHEAVAAGLDQLIAMTEDGGDISLAVAHLLAQFPERAETTGPVIHGLLDNETDSMGRAGLLLLLASLRDRSEATVKVLASALQSDDIPQRRAAAVLAATLRLDPALPGTEDAIQEAVDAEDLEDVLSGLPWDVGAEIDFDDLIDALDSQAE